MIVILTDSLNYITLWPCRVIRSSKLELGLFLVYILQRTLLLLLLCLLLLFIFAANILELTIILFLLYSYTYIYFSCLECFQSYAQIDSKGILQREPSPTSLPSVTALAQKHKKVPITSFRCLIELHLMQSKASMEIGFPISHIFILDKT